MELRPAKLKGLERVELRLHHTIAGNGLGAFNIPQVSIRVEGGAQDGVGKGAFGGQHRHLEGERTTKERAWTEASAKVSLTAPKEASSPCKVVQIAALASAFLALMSSSVAK
jgi:hypothetical protein